MRVLTLTNPRTKGPDVTKVQKALGTRVDGTFGPSTAQAVLRWKRMASYTAQIIARGAPFGF